MAPDPLVPEVPDEEVLGPAPAPRRASEGAGAPRSWRSRGLAWFLIGLLLLSIVWGLLVIAP